MRRVVHVIFTLERVAQMYWALIKKVAPNDFIVAPNDFIVANWRIRP